MRLHLHLIYASALMTAESLAEPLQNGSFESAGVSSGTEMALTPISTDLTDWSIDGGTGIYYLKDGNPLGVGAVEGVHMVSFGRNGGHGGSISQVFGTVPGTTYEVTYWITQTEWNAEDGQTMSVEAFDGATSLAPAVDNNLPLTQNQWSQGASYTFTATSASTKLTFRDTTPGSSGSSSSWALDAVAVAPATNPGNLLPFDPKPSGRVHAAAIQPDGRIIIAGDFATLQTGTPQQVSRERLARLNPDGTVDEAFYPFPDGPIYAVAVLENGQILVGGDFAKLQKGGSGSANPELFRTDLALLNPDGSVDTSFDAKLSGGWSVLSILPLADGRVYIGGNFANVDDVPHARVALLNPNGTPDPSFNYQAPAEVTNMAVDSQNRVLLGSYHNVGPGRVTRIGANGALDSSFNPSPDFTVNSLQVQADGKVLIGGYFDNIGINPIKNLARVNDDGSWDDSFLPGAGTKVLSVTVLANRRILATGDFNEFGTPSPPTAYGLASIEETGALDSSLNPLTASAIVFHAIPDRDGHLLVLSQGTLQTAQGTRSFMAKLEGTPAFDLLSASSNTRVEWLRNGGSAEPAYVVFDLSTDNGATWTRLGTGSRAPGGWELTGLTLPGRGKLRARARFNSSTAYYSGSSLLERVEDFTVPLTVPGEANLWLSGQPDGTPAEVSDVAPDQSPIAANISLVPGKDLVFQVFGGTHNGPAPGTTGPDGGDAANHSPENGIGPMSAPLNALVGVFLNDDTPAQPTPSLFLDFSSPDNRNLPILQPGLRQPFFIGDGLDDELNTQHFRVPDGATRLFLGSFDAFTNKENFGQFTVIVDQVEPASLPVLPESFNFTIIPGNSELPWTFSIDQDSMADDLVLRVESTLDPNDPLSWTDLPTGSAMTRSGNTWVLSVANPPVGNRYFRVVAEAPWYESSETEFQDENEVTIPILIERPVIDTIPPTLNITHTWMEKAGKVTYFKMLLDPQDETGFDPGLSEGNPKTAIEFRSVLNSTAPIPGNGGWQKWAWQRGIPFSVGFNCTSIVIEVRAVDAAGNKSPLQRRTFRVPFPYGPGPNLEPRFSSIVPLAGDAIDCRGLFAARFDDEGQGDDVLQIDRTTGEVRVRRQGNGGAFTDNSFFLTPGSITDSAIGDFDSDDRPDIAIVVDGTLKVFRNDGVDGGGALQFSEIAVGGLLGAGIANITHCAVGNVTADGWPDIVVTGTGDDGMGGTIAKVAVIINTPDFHLTGANSATAPIGADSGLVRLGDVDGDGWLDAVMVDTAGNRLITFRNKQNGDFGSATESDPEFAAKTVVTGFPPLPAQALAVGDVTGDGRADAVVVLHHFASRNQNDPNDIRDHQLWQLFDARPDGSLQGHSPRAIGQGLSGVGPTDFRSDVTLSDVNGDRFPELIFTSQFEAPPAPGGSPGGVLVVRIDSNLDPTNALIGFQSHETAVPTNAAHPHRLATGRHGNTGQRDIVLANGSTPSLQWILNRYSKLSKPLEIQGGLHTESDPDGTELPNGILTYTAYPGEFIDYTVSYANNTPNTLTDATIDCVLPPTLESPPVQADPGHQILVAKAARIIRWTETLPPGAAGVKQFRVRILPTAKIGTPIAPINVIRKGKTAASSLMPNLKIEHPLSFEYTSVSTGPNPFGLINPPHFVPIGDPTGRTAHLGDPIRWRIKLRNRASIPIQNIKIQVPMPRGVKFDGPVHAIPGMTYQVTPLVANDRNPTPTQIAFTIPTMAPFSSTDDLFFIDGTVEEDPGLTVPRDPKGRPVMNPGFQIKMQPTVEAPGLPKRAEAAFITTLSPTLGIEIYANKEAVSPGETIDYTVVARNWGSADLQNARVVNEIPLGSKLVSVRTRDTGGGGVHFDDSPLDADSLSPSPSTIAPGLLAGAWPTLVWDLGTVPGGAHRIMRYTVVVGADVPTTIPIAGQPNPVKIINGTYNFTGFFSATHAAAFLPANPKVASVPSAAAVTQLPKRNGAKAVASVLSSDNPQSLPSLTVRKRILGPRDESLPSDFKYPFLASEEKNGTEHFYLTNTRSSSLDGVMSYYFEVQNTGTSAVHNVYVHDLIPANVQFQGWVARDGNLVSSFSKFRFYEGLRGIQLDNGHEPFSDNNGSGQWEFPETFEDKNGNRRFDGLESIRRLSLWVGDLAPGQTATFIYQVKLIGEPKPGTLIVSEGGSTSIPPKTIPNGLTYLLKEGYYLTANELHYPVFAQISKVVAEVSEPLRNILPDIHPRSREGLDDDQEIEIGIPYAISGAPGIRVVGSQMTFDVPAGYEVLGVRLVAKDAHGDLKTVRKFVKSAAYERPATPTWPGDDTAPAGSITTPLVKGLTRVTVPLNDPTRPSPLTDPTNPLAKGDVRASVVFLHCRIDPAKAALLRGIKGESAGYTVNPLRVVPVISGGRPVVNASGFAFLQEQLRQLEPTAAAGGLPSLALAGGLTVFQAATGGAVGVGTPVAPSSSEVLLDVRSDTEKDAKVFIGRCAPIAVREGGEITYTIFVGNLTDRELGRGIVTMQIPNGCELVSATAPQYNGVQTNQVEVGSPLENATFKPSADEVVRLSDGGLEYRWRKQPKSKLIQWDIFHLLPSQVDCMTLTVRVLPGQLGKTITDDTCSIQGPRTMDKSPGPIATTVIKGDWTAEQGRAVQGAIEGAGFQLTSKGENVLRQSFTPRETSCTITFGGANLLQLKPNSHGKAASLIPLPFDRVFAIGHPDKVSNYQRNGTPVRELLSTPNLRIVVGPGTKHPTTRIPNGVVVNSPPGQPSGIYAANELFNRILNSGLNEFGTLFLAGGGSVVDGGAGTLDQAATRPVPVTPPRVIPGTNPVTTQLSGQVKVDATFLAPATTAPAGPTDVIVNPDGTPIVAVGGGNVLSHNGNAVVANDGAGVVANDGAGLIGDGAGTLVGNDGASLIGQDGAALIGQDGAALAPAGDQLPKVTGGVPR